MIRYGRDRLDEISRDAGFTPVVSDDTRFAVEAFIDTDGVVTTVAMTQFAADSLRDHDALEPFWEEAPIADHWRTHLAQVTQHLGAQR